MNKKILFIVLGLSLLLFMLDIRICPFFNLFHIPCPACGLTRAFLLFLQGRVIESFRYNILVIPIIVGFILYGIAVITKRNNCLDSFLIKHNKFFIGAALILMLITEFININNDLLY